MTLPSSPPPAASSRVPETYGLAAAAHAHGLDQGAAAGAHAPRDGAGRLPPDGAEPRGDVRSGRDPRRPQRRLRARRGRARHLGRRGSGKLCETDRRSRSVTPATSRCDESIARAANSVTSPRLRGEVDVRSASGEGDSRRVRSSRRFPLTPTLSPLAGRGSERSCAPNLNREASCRDDACRPGLPRTRRHAARIPHDRPAAGRRADHRDAARRARLRRSVGRVSREACRRDRRRRVRLFARRLRPVVALACCRVR